MTADHARQVATSIASRCRPVDPKEDAAAADVVASRLSDELAARLFLWWIRPSVIRAWTRRALYAGHGLTNDGVLVVGALKPPKGAGADWWPAGTPERARRNAVATASFAATAVAAFLPLAVAFAVAAYVADRVLPALAFIGLAVASWLALAVTSVFIMVKVGRLNRSKPADAWYLHDLARRSDAPKHLGLDLLNALADVADAADWTIALHTSVDGLVEHYRRAGFELIGSTRTPLGTTHLMVRTPTSSRIPSPGGPQD